MEWITYCTEIEHLSALKEHGITTVLVGEPLLATRIPVRFSFEEIREIKQACDQLGLKLGLMMNRIFFDEEIEMCRQALQRYQSLNPARIDYTDPAVFIEARKLQMEHLLNYNPDTLMCNDKDVQFYLNLGIDGVVLSKEITLQEMKEIGERTQGNKEIIIFGRLNMSYSRRPLITSYLKEIQGDCDISHRQDLVLIETTRQGKMPIVEDEQGTAIYTDYTLAGFGELIPLQASGIQRFRFDNSFMTQSAFLSCLEGFQQVIQGAKAEEVMIEKMKQFPELALSTGYMYQKTNLVK